MAERHFLELLRILPLAHAPGGETRKVQKLKVCIRSGVHAAKAGIKLEGLSGKPSAADEQSHGGSLLMLPSSLSFRIAASSTGRASAPPLNKPKVYRQAEIRMAKAARVLYKLLFYRIKLCLLYKLRCDKRIRQLVRKRIKQPCFLHLAFRHFAKLIYFGEEHRSVCRA